MLIFYIIMYCNFKGIGYNISERTPPEHARVLNQRTRYVEVALGFFIFCCIICVLKSILQKVSYHLSNISIHTYPIYHFVDIFYL